MKILFFEDSTKTLFGGGQKISSFALKSLIDSNYNVTYCDFRINKFLFSQAELISNNFILLRSNRNNIFSICFSIFYNILKLIFIIKTHLSHNKLKIYNIFFSFFLFVGLKLKKKYYYYYYCN